jgi:hypothetical protein
MKTIDLYGSENQGISPFVNAQQRLNCFFEVIPSGEKGVQIYIRFTPGFSTWLTLPTSPIQGFLVVNNLLYVVAGSTLYSVTQAGVYNTIGPISGVLDQAAMETNGNQILICTGNSGWVYYLNTYNLVPAGTLVQITDPNFNQYATSCCYLNGFFIVNNDVYGQWITSSLDDGTVWPALNYATIATTPDNLVALDAFGGSLILWGERSMEYWQDTGNYPFPFTLLVGTAQEWGLAALYSRSAFNNSMIFLATNASSHYQVMLLENYEPVRVSDHNIEHIINGFSTVTDAIGFSYSIDGHIFYQLTFPTANRSFLYDAITSLWSEIQTGTQGYTRHTANLGVGFDGVYYITDSTTGNIYELDQEFTTDNGAEIKRQLRTRHLEDQGNKFIIDEVFLDLSLGQGIATGQGSNPQISMQVSKDNGNTFGNERWISVGQAGQYRAPRAVWRTLGQARDFVLQFTFTDPITLVIVKGSARIRDTTEKGNK